MITCGDCSWFKSDEWKIGVGLCTRFCKPDGHFEETYEDLDCRYEEYDEDE